MDIVFLTTSMARGGAETQMVRIATTLRRRGWNTAIVTMLAADHVFPELAGSGVEVLACPGHPRRAPWRMLRSLTRQLRHWRPAVLVTFNYPADVLGRFSGRLAGVPATVSALGTAHLKSGLRGAFYRYTESLVARTVSNSNAAVALMTGKRILTPGKTQVIPNGLILADFPSPLGRAEARARLGVGDAAFLWLAVGNLRDAKDYPALLEACQQCAGSAPGFQVKIAGGGPLAAPLAAEVERRGLGGVVEFLGPRQDVPDLLRAADAYVLSSAWEGSPNTLMEAMASGLPAVATDVGDVRELVAEGVAGFVVPTRDPAALARGMGAMMALDGPARAAMGAEGRQEISRHYDNERVADRWEALFLELGGKPGA